MIQTKHLSNNYSVNRTDNVDGNGDGNGTDNGDTPITAENAKYIQAAGYYGCPAQIYDKVEGTNYWQGRGLDTRRLVHEEDKLKCFKSKNNTWWGHYELDDSRLQYSNTMPSPPPGMPTQKYIKAREKLYGCPVQTYTKTDGDYHWVGNGADQQRYLVFKDNKLKCYKPSNNTWWGHYEFNDSRLEFSDAPF